MHAFAPRNGKERICRLKNEIFVNICTGQQRRFASQSLEWLHNSRERLASRIVSGIEAAEEFPHDRWICRGTTKANRIGAKRHGRTCLPFNCWQTTYLGRQPEPFLRSAVFPLNHRLPCNLFDARHSLIGCCSLLLTMLPFKQRTRVVRDLLLLERAVSGEMRKVASVTCNLYDAENS